MGKDMTTGDPFIYSCNRHLAKSIEYIGIGNEVKVTNLGFTRTCEICNEFNGKIINAKWLIGVLK